MKKQIFSAAVVALSLMTTSLMTVQGATTDDSVWSTQNDYLRLSVENRSSEGEYLRFNLETVKGDENNADDDEKALLYSNFFSGYTTIHYDGHSSIYGRGDDICEPYYDAETKEYISKQKFGELSVEQRLSFAKGFTNEYDDMLKITYSVANLCENTSLVGLRILIDPMLDSDDKCSVQIDDIEFPNEACFYSDNIPKVWSVKSYDGNVTAFGKIESDIENPVDTIAFANWDSLFDNRWNYSVDTSAANKDCAVAFLWEDEELEKGEALQYTAYYGVKNTIKAEEATNSPTTAATEGSTMSASEVKQNSNQGSAKPTDAEKVTSANTDAIENPDTSAQANVIATGSAGVVVLLILVFISAAAVVAFRRRGANNEKTK